MRTTHSFANLQVSQATYDEIMQLLMKANYYHAFIKQNKEDNVLIDMHGIALSRDPIKATPPELTEEEKDSLKMTRGD